MEPQTPDVGPGYTDEEDERVDDCWRPESMVDADWCLKRLGDLQAQKESNEWLTSQALERETARLQLRLERMNESVERGIIFFTARLRGFWEAHKKDLLTGRKKSRAFPHGTLGTRIQPARLEVQDAAKLIDWAASQKDPWRFVRVDVAPAMAEVQAHFKATGEVPPGCEVKPEDEKFAAKPTTEERETDA